MRPYKSSDRAAVRAICADTGFMGAPIDPIFSDRDAFADFFTQYYTDHEPEHCFVAEDRDERRIIGYLLGCVQPRRQLVLGTVNLILRTVPEVAFRFVTGRYDRASREFLRWMLWRSMAETPPAPRAAAHFHVNLLPAYRTGVAGRELIFGFLERIRAEGVPRVYGQIQTRDDRRTNFWIRYGFRELSRRRITKFQRHRSEPVYVTTLYRDFQETDAHSSSRRLIVSFHDLHPGSRAACERFLTKLTHLGVPRISLLVVPRWHGAPPGTEDASFVQWLHDCVKQGHEICLHGFFHRAESVKGGVFARFIGRVYTNSEGEFFQITRTEADRRVAEGLALLRKAAGLPVEGFTPPAWLLSAAGRDALIAAGLRYSTSWREIELFEQDRTISAPTIVYSSRNAWRRAVSRLWVRGWFQAHRDAPLLRLAIHPLDLAYPKIEASLLRLAQVALCDGRRPITYGDLLSTEATHLRVPSMNSA